MLYLQQVVIKSFAAELTNAYRETYSVHEQHYSEILGWAGQLALENIANSDALYHNTDHTMMVSMVGQAILRGKHLYDGGVTPRDWLHFMMALLFHDIGYVRGVCRNDRGNRYATGIEHETIELPFGGTDVALTQYHVDRSKLFVRERFGGRLLVDVDTELIASYIEMTRFQVPDSEAKVTSTDSYRGLARAADFIGQLGDPRYLEKIPALFYEFEEIGYNEGMGYKTPGDMRTNFAKFYWSVVRPYVKDALKYLRITQEGKQWVANLHSHVFDIEHEVYGK
ncbi:hypothetical protein QUF63_05430 [Anaerolineales bacterium HSG25]|nr:hypothetical protein [Anaerolineales bacterium HSG25]